MFHFGKVIFSRIDETYRVQQRQRMPPPSPAMRSHYEFESTETVWNIDVRIVKRQKRQRARKKTSKHRTRVMNNTPKRRRTHKILCCFSFGSILLLLFFSFFFIHFLFLLFCKIDIMSRWSALQPFFQLNGIAGDVELQLGFKTIPCLLFWLRLNGNNNIDKQTKKSDKKQQQQNTNENLCRTTTFNLATICTLLQMQSIWN